MIFFRGGGGYFQCFGFHRLHLLQLAIVALLVGEGGTIAVRADVLSETQLAPLDPSFVSLNLGDGSDSRKQTVSLL